MSAFASHVLMPAQCPDDVIAAVVAAMPQLSPEHVATVYAKLIRAAGTPPPADPAAYLILRKGRVVGFDFPERANTGKLAEDEALVPVSVASYSASYVAVDSDPLGQFLREVYDEALRAGTLFPGDTLRTLAFSEEAGELVKAVLDESPERVRHEAVQAAAMAARIALDGDGSVVEWRKAKGLAPL